jgi:threonine synthase
LDEFFRTGRYRPRGGPETHETSSPSMDISKASNFERFVWDACGRDGDCNPGNDGSGEICEGGRCVAGCRYDSHCPGVTRCVAGTCR